MALLIILISSLILYHLYCANQKQTEGRHWRQELSELKRVTGCESVKQLIKRYHEIIDLQSHAFRQISDHQYQGKETNPEIFYALANTISAALASNRSPHSIQSVAVSKQLDVKYKLYETFPKIMPKLEGLTLHQLSILCSNIIAFNLTLDQSLLGLRLSDEQKTHRVMQCQDGFEVYNICDSCRNRKEDNKHYDKLLTDTGLCYSCKETKRVINLKIIERLDTYDLSYEVFRDSGGIPIYDKIKNLSYQQKWLAKVGNFAAKVRTDNPLTHHI